MTKIKDLKNPKEMVSRLDWKFHQKFKIIKIKIEGSF